MRRRTKGLYDFYETAPRTATALELRNFGEEAISRLPNWGNERRSPRDAPVEVADTYVISNTNPVNFGSDGHTGLVIIPDDGNPENNFLYDPNGSYPSREFGSDRTLWGPGVSLKDYVRYQMTDGPAVFVHEVDTNAEQEKEIQERIEQIGGSPLTYWNLPGMGCTTGVSRAIDGVGPFGKIEETMWPSKLYEQLERAKRYKRKFHGM